MWFSTASAVLRLRRTLLVPICFRVSLRKKNMPDILTYTVTAGPTTDADVVTRTVTVSINGETSDSRDYPADTLTFAPLVVSEGDNVVMTLVDTDNAGNPSAPAVVEFVAADTLPPAQPGGFGVTLVSESSAE